MPVNLIAKIVPKNDGFVGLVDAKQIIGDGATNVLPSNTIPNDFVKLDQSSPQDIINGRLVFDNGLDLGLAPTLGVNYSGKIYWDNNVQTAAVDLDVNLTLHLGQDSLAYVYNGTGGDLIAGQAVYISGTQSGYPSVNLAVATASASSYVLGLIASSVIADGDYGYVVARGYIKSFDTSAWSEGDILFLDYSIAGGLTNVEPSNGNYDVRIGRVMVQDSSVGSIYVNLRPLTTLTEIGDVTITGPVADDTLVYNGTEWVNSRLVKITVGTTQPVNPTIGDLWVDTN